MWFALAMAAQAAELDQALQTDIRAFMGGKAGQPIPPELLSTVQFVEAMGGRLYRADHAASRATDALMASGLWAKDDRIRGWLTEPQPGGVDVVFIGESNGENLALYRLTAPDGDGAAVLVDLQTRAPIAAARAVGAPLTADQAAAWRARRLAIHAKWERLATTYNAEVLTVDGASGPEYWVYLLAATTDPKQWIMAGHQLVVVSADGATVTPQPLSLSYLTMDLSKLPKDAVPSGNVVSAPLYDFPRENHVFTNLHYHLDLVVIGEHHLWRVHDGKIEYLEPMPK